MHFILLQILEYCKKLKVLDVNKCRLPIEYLSQIKLSGVSVKTDAFFDQTTNVVYKLGSKKRRFYLQT